METRVINGILFRNMCKGGLKAILAEEQKVNGLNVFPVPDGDTGTNMKLTLEHGVKDSSDVESIGEFSKALARGMLLGARGNSGVILSQLFKGMSKYLKKLDVASVSDFAQALEEGYKTAYMAVEKPVEGTILTVARLGILNIMGILNEDTTLEEFMELYIKSMKDVLKTTPELLPVLKEAGVIDSGGAGLIVIYSGMENVLLDRENFDDSFLGNVLLENEEKNRNGYPLEVVLKIGNKESFSYTDFQNGLKELGDISEISYKKGIVSFKAISEIPGDMINYSCHFGILFKSEISNPDFNADEVKEARKLPFKHIQYIAVSQGEGFTEQFKDFGCDIILDGGKTMNTSTEEFMDALEMTDADEVIILPNNKNVILAALQAKDIYGSSHVHVLNTKSLVEGYFAFSMCSTDDTDIDIDQQIRNMETGIEGIHTFGVTMAVKDSSYNGISITRGEYISVLDGDIVYTSATKEDAVIEGLKKVKDIEDKEIMILFRGHNLNEDEADSIIEVLSDDYPNAQSGVIEGGQDTYGVLIGIS